LRQSLEMSKIVLYLEFLYIFHFSVMFLHFFCYFSYFRNPAQPEDV
jgi:hypothetical protein